jgi:predicted helicase
LSIYTEKAAIKVEFQVIKIFFSITQGVCITFLIKNSKLIKEEKEIFYYSVSQNNISRAEKLNFLANTKFCDLQFTKLNPQETKDIYFIPRDLTHKKEYENFIKLNEIFNNPTLPNANFTQNFIKNHLQQIDFQPVPEEILAYIYAVLHSTVYRTKYIEFLKTDFPAVPMTKNNISLGSSDLQHLKNMIIALKNTILTMKEIEDLGENYLK